MGSSLDALNAPSSLTQRRQAAAGLPAFELPAPPSFPSLHGQKYPPLTHSLHHHASAVSVGNLLTPPSNSASDSSAASSAIPTGSTPNSGPPVLPYTPTFFNQASTPGFHTGLTPHAWQPNHLIQRSMFSPPGPGLYRHGTNSPTAAEASSLPPPPYDLSQVPQYGMPMGMASPTGASLASQPQVLTNPMQLPGRPPSQQSGHTSMSDISKPASAPSLYTQVPVSAAGYPYPNGTPVSQSPHSANGHASRSPPMHHHQQMQSNNFIRPPFPSYSLPAMPGPAMSNVHSPGSQMSMVGHPGSLLPMGFNSGYAASPHQSYYGQPKPPTPQQNTQNDRPFRCDACPQSFHRNHDLKRHKRIHLAVKPFPCPNCDKSFSRKDALKVRLTDFPTVVSTHTNIRTAAQARQRLRQQRRSSQRRWRQVRVWQRQHG